MKIKSPAKIADFYSFHGFKTRSSMTGVLGDRYARVIKLERQKKQPFALLVDTSVMEDTISTLVGQEIFQPQVVGFIWSMNAGVYTVPSAGPCL